MALVDRWLAGRFLRAYLIFTASALFLFLVIDLFSNMDSLLRRGLLIGMFERYGAQLPELFFTLSPHLILLAGLWVVVSLQRANELVPLLAAGYSVQRIAAPILAAGALVALLAWADRELLLPRLAHLRRIHGLKQDQEFVPPIPDGQDRVLSARFYLPPSRELVEPRLIELDPGGAEQRTILAARATYPEPGVWLFEQGWVITRAPDGSDAVAPIASGGLRVPSRISLSDVEASIDSPTYLSEEQLRAQLERTPAFKHLEVQIYERYAQPLAGLALLLIGLPIGFTGSGAGVYGRVLACVGLSVAYFFAATICYELGSDGALPARWAALLPLGGFGLIGLGLFIRAR